MFKKTWLAPVIVISALLAAIGGVMVHNILAQESLPAPRAIGAVLGSAFNYQGQIADDSGEPIDGACDINFILFGAATGGASLGQVTKTNQPVADGLFAVTLDFGTSAFSGDARWLELTVRCPANSGTYKTLSPRQEIAAVPYAFSLKPGARIEGSIPAGANFDAGVRVTNSSPNYPIALFGIAAATSGPAIGVAGNNSSPDGFGVHGYSYPDGTAVRGEANKGIGVWGSSVDWVGTYGYSEKAFGVFGESENGSGVVGKSTNWVGVYGESAISFGVYGKSDNQSAVVGVSQTGVGVYGESSSGPAIQAKSTGTGPGMFASSQSGPAAIFDGLTRTDILEIVGGSDLAERFEVSGDAMAEPGTVMVIDPDNPGHLTPATTAYDRKVAGVVSGAGDVETGLVLHQEGVLEGDTVVAIAGRVYVKAEALSGAIRPGDMLTSSDIPGYAMLASDHDRAQGSVIGKAMTGLDSGQGLVLVLINLQ